MGKKGRERPKRLAEKLLHIRQALGFSQSRIIRRMDCWEELSQAKISLYERGEREPPLKVLLAYARLANVYVDVLIDDEIGLPKKLPARRKSMGLRKRKWVRRPR